MLRGEIEFDYRSVRVLFKRFNIIKKYLSNRERKDCVTDSGIELKYSLKWICVSTRQIACFHSSVFQMTDRSERTPLIPEMREFGVSIFTEMTQLALEHDAINLSQGYPSYDGPDFIVDAASDALNSGKNQYAPSIGVRSLRNALAKTYQQEHDLSFDPENEITVFSGATEAVFSSLQALVRDGEEVVLFEPYYDLYPPAIAMAGGKRTSLPIKFPEYKVPFDRLEETVDSNTRALILNTPMNPTGKVFRREELERIGKICKEHDVTIITDEVYERITFESSEHVPMASIPGMRDRTITISSAAKTFSVTGWKIGWACAPPALSEAIRSTHQFVTFSSGTPFQHGVAAALDQADSYYQRLKKQYTKRREVLCSILEDTGFNVVRPEGTYFVLADFTPFGFQDDVEFCKYITRELKVAAIPPTAFYDHPEEGKTLARFAFCKEVEELKQAGERLQKLSP